MTISWKFSGVLSLCILAIVAAANIARAADDPSPFKFEFHGFAGASAYLQSNPAQVLNGQGPLLYIKEAATSGETTTGFDLRQTRLAFSVTGPEVLGGAVTKAYIETDFFNVDGPGGYGEINLMNRLRIAYAELNWGDTSIRVGQDWELLFNEYPQSLGHMAFPVTYFAGLSGWREAGIGVFHRMNLSDTQKLEGAIQIMRSDWESPYDFGKSTNNDLNLSSGQLSALPAVEARIKWSDDVGFVYVAGHWGRADGGKVANLAYVNGADNDATAARTWDIEEAKIGGKYSLAGFTLQGDFYVGKNTAPLIGEELQWYTANDVTEAGGWVQLGYNFTKELSLWGVYGTSRSSQDDVVSAGGGRYANTVYGGMLLYREGPFGFGPEFYHIQTKSTKAAGDGAPDGIMDGYQAMLSANLYF